ncbi:MAG TPA: sugar phosphate isomerase [Clostridiales bacterium]|nr:sugar phosphate isomerase [Clostridiales bacterium]
MGLIPIGTLVSAKDALQLLPRVIPLGFECFSITFWQDLGGQDLKETAARIREILDPAGLPVSCISIFSNPLTDDPAGQQAIRAWEALIDAASLFGTDLVTGFTGRIPDVPIDKCMPRFGEVFRPLAKRAADRGVRLAFENCNMGGTWQRGTWNIAHGPAAWEMMFQEVPDGNVGLQWEPCHQMVALVDPVPQLRKWAKKVFSVHGKDATIAWDVVRESGIYGNRPFAWHRTPGFEDSNWADLITILMMNGYPGTIDIEGYHDPVYRGDLEWTGQARGLQYLKEARGGTPIPGGDKI